MSLQGGVFMGGKKRTVLSAQLAIPSSIHILSFLAQDNRDGLSLPP